LVAASRGPGGARWWVTSVAGLHPLPEQGSWRGPGGPRFRPSPGRPPRPIPARACARRL